MSTFYEQNKIGRMVTNKYTVLKHEQQKLHYIQVKNRKTLQRDQKSYLRYLKCEDKTQRKLV